MDERVIERMVVRSYRTVSHWSTLLAAAAILFLAALGWAAFRSCLMSTGGVVHIAFVALALSVASIFFAPMLAPLVRFSLSIRSGEESISFFRVMGEQYKQMLFLLSQSVVIVLGQAILLLLILVWIGLETIPLFGWFVSVFSSWLPALLSGCSLLLFLAHVIVLFTARVPIAQQTIIDVKKPWELWPERFFQDWLIRLKLVLLGLFPSIIFIVASLYWPIPYGDGFAVLFRALAFALLEAPLFLFAVHMAVETDRYVQWLSARRLG